MGKRVFLIVLDSVGIGEAPDAALFGDAGADTLGSCFRSGGLRVPTLERLGLFDIAGTSFFRGGNRRPLGCFGKLEERSAGKDTTIGHWELAGLVSPSPLPTFPKGFPREVIDAIREASGREVLCNLPYSGTEVIKDYGPEQEKTGALIVYTSVDSVCQIAAHEEIVPLKELYEICRKTRRIMTGKYGVGRIIARPFVGRYPHYERTVNRHDFSLEPPAETVLDAVLAAGQHTVGVGKIGDIFAGRGIAESYPNEGNDKNMDRTMELLEKDFTGLCFVNLVDFDMLYGHRRDVSGYTEALNRVDGRLGAFIKKMRPEDLLIVTADHGCDPAFTGTDHTREYVPVLCCGKAVKRGADLGVRRGFCDIAQTAAEYLGVPFRGAGTGFLREMSAKSSAP